MHQRQGIGRMVKAAMLASAAVVSLAPSAAWAQPTRQYSIPASDAGDAVQRVAQQSGLQVIAPEADLRSVRTNAIDGNYTAVEALRRMLAGTTLEVLQTGDGPVTIRRAAPDAVAADTAAPESSEVTVTGSRIQRPGFDTLQAATSTDSTEIARRSYTNVLEALQDTPGFAPAGSSQVGTQQGTLGIAQSFANFFGLGSQRTLSLVNGRRFISTNTVSGSGGAGGSPGSQVDLNLMPVGLVERVETVAIGGAPVYGSDAIAGTVNVILKDKYQGLQLNAQTSITELGDAANQAVRGLWGTNFAEGRGNLVLAAEYVRQEGFTLRQRFPFRFLTSSGNTNPSDGISSLMVIDDYRYAALTDGGLPYRAGVPQPSSYIRDAAGNPVQFGPDGNLIPFAVGGSFLGSSAGAIPIAANGGDGLNPARYTSLLSPNDRYLLNALGNFDVTDNVNVFFEGAYAHSSGTKISDLFQFAAPGILGGPALTISANNPFLNAQARGILAANGVTSFQLNRNFNDVADRRPARVEFDVYRIVAGVKGDFSLGDQAWNWDASYNFGHGRNRAEFNSINLTRLQNALNATSTTTCAVGGACVPINIFGEGAASDASVDYVLDRGIGVSKNEMEVFSANLGGRLPFGIAGPIAIGVGYEHRRESGSFDADAILNGGLTLLGGAVAFPDAPEGSFNTDEVYGEAVVPLLDEGMSVPLVKSLQAEGAIRYVDHSTAGGDITWSAGARLQTSFIDGLTLRGVYTRAIRNPSLVELFLNPTPTARAANDICAASRVNAGPNPARRLANCTAALTAAGGPAPTAFLPTTNGASPFGVVGGNPNLDNEKARSYSFGLVYQPPSSNLRLALDYSHIRVNGAISRFTLPTAQSACYDSPNYPNEGGCQAFRRLTAAEAAAQTAATGRARIAGDIADGFLESYFNSATLDFAGIIGEINYAFAVPNIAGDTPGQLRLGVKAFYVDHFRSQTSGAAPVIEAQGTVGSPRWDVNGRIGYAFDPFDLDVQVLWQSKTVGDRTATIENTPVNDYPSYTLVNTTLGARVTDNFSLQFTVRNLFDRKVPYAATVTRAFGAFDIFGRTYSVRAAVTF